jgi:hypothetical protein
MKVKPSRDAGSSQEPEVRSQKSGVRRESHDQVTKGTKLGDSLIHPQILRGRLLSQVFLK